MTNSSPIDVAIIEDDPDQLRLVRHVLERAGFAVCSASDMRTGSELVGRNRPKVVVCNYDLPDGDGIRLCRSLRKCADLTSTYYILISAMGGSELASHALDAGADDYLTKPVTRQELTSRVRAGTRMWTMHDQLRRAALTDGLTGLYSHDHFNRVLEMEMARSRRYGHPLALIMIDIDFFKAVNDTFGHLAGNSVLEEVARIVRKGVRDIDTIGRVGGEEFAIILPEARAADAAQAAERIRVDLPKSLSVKAIHGHVLTASFGVADSEDLRVGSAADLFDLADRALYMAKRHGRNRVARGSELDEGAEIAESIQTDEVEWLQRRLAVLSARVRDVYVQSVASMLQVLDEKDPCTARHAVNVAFYAEQIAEQMGCSRGTRKSIYNASLLHDIGMVGVPDRILMKQTPLTPFEQMVIAQVPLIGTRIVNHMRILESEVQIIRHQREYFDGSGIPVGLRGRQIPVGSRILLVADAFDSMTTDRVYRQRRPIDEAVAELRRFSGTQFDPQAVTSLRQVLERNRSAWERRIDETIEILHVPGEGRVDSAADRFLPDTC